ncbi:VOC family protein [Tepidicaulis sp. LMO-SS28]|uniref:VOC family protein n=1 Tax=Tepidicaulis sp. LMO-SS28 TaxID=3447455 RepID=UPI003EE2C5B2
MIDIVDHILIAVPELDGPVADYVKLTGREPSWRGRHPGLGSANALFRFSNTYVELISPDGEGRFGDLIRERLADGGPQIVGLALGVEDAAGAAAMLKERGMTPSGLLPGEGTDESGTLPPRRWTNVMLPGEETNGLLIFLIEHEDRLAIPFSKPAAGVNGRAAAEAIDHVVINTPDADGVIALLKDKLGLRLALDNTVEKWGVRQVFFRTGRMTIEIIMPIDEKRRPSKDHFWGITFRYPDLEKTRARMVEAGLDVGEVRTGRKKGTVVATPKGATLGIPTLLLAPERAG